MIINAMMRRWCEEQFAYKTVKRENWNQLNSIITMIVFLIIRQWSFWENRWHLFSLITTFTTLNVHTHTHAHTHWRTEELCSAEKLLLPSLDCFYGKDVLHVCCYVGNVKRSTAIVAFDSSSLLRAVPELLHSSHLISHSKTSCCKVLLLLIFAFCKWLPHKNQKFNIIILVWRCSLAWLVAFTWGPFLRLCPRNRIILGVLEAWHT